MISYHLFVRFTQTMWYNLAMKSWKECRSCKIVKPLVEFSKKADTADGYRSRCKICDAEWYCSWKAANPGKAREAWRRASNRYQDRGLDLWKKYGLTYDDYLKLGDAQAWTCLICGKKTHDLVVDHCHNSGYVRALLCASCNGGIGLLGDDPERLVAAAEYLRAVKLTGFRAGTGTRELNKRSPRRSGRKLCCDCGKACSEKALRCRACHAIHMYSSRKTKLAWPPVEELIRLVETTSYLSVGRMLGVTDNAVRKHIATELRYQSRVA
jgi:hypothetical protein